jgi:hypothetical protein
MACALGTGTDKRLLQLLDAGRAYARRAATPTDVEAALREADLAACEVGKLARADVWSIFEGRRAGDAAAHAQAARATTAAMRWAFRLGGTPPPIPASWAWAKKAFTDSANAPVCEAAWRTQDVLSLARLVQTGVTDALPILADALQDAGCEDERILDHCRSNVPHCAGCWVPDLILDTE